MWNDYFGHPDYDHDDYDHAGYGHHSDYYSDWGSAPHIGIDADLAQAAILDSAHKMHLSD